LRSRNPRVAAPDRLPGADPLRHGDSYRHAANGLKYFVRQNDRPAKRVSLRLGVKAGSLNEADDQQGLAHLIEHMPSTAARISRRASW